MGLIIGLLMNIVRCPVSVFVTFSVNKSENIRRAAFNLRLADRQRRLDGELASAKKRLEEIQKTREENLELQTENVDVDERIQVSCCSLCDLQCQQIGEYSESRI